MDSRGCSRLRPATPTPITSNVDNPSPANPYDTWGTAANTIQEAVDAATGGDTVLVADGVDTNGGAARPGFGLTNRVLIATNITVKSVHGAASTLIVGAETPGGGNGDGAVRGVLMLHREAEVCGFTITNGHARTSGGPSDTSGAGV